MAGSTLADKLGEAEDHWRAGRYDAALASYRSALDDPARGAMHISAAARALIACGYVQEGCAAVARGLEQGVASPDCLLLMALERLQSRPEICRQVFDRLISEFPHWDLARVGTFHLDPASAASMDPPFPATGIEQSYADSRQWLQSLTPDIPWTGFPVQVLLEGLAAARDPGLIVECGVYFGRSLDVLARNTALPVHGFDSFQGLAEDWLDQPAGSYSTGGALPGVGPGVTLHPGWFEDTLPGFAREYRDKRIALLHIDCDTYPATKTVLEHLGPLTDPDTVFVFDDLTGIAQWRDHECRALLEFAADRSMTVISAALVGREVALRIG